MGCQRHGGPSRDQPQQGYQYRYGSTASGWDSQCAPSNQDPVTTSTTHKTSQPCYSCAVPAYRCWRQKGHMYGQSVRSNLAGMTDARGLYDCIRAANAGSEGRDKSCTVRQPPPQAPSRQHIIEATPHCLRFTPSGILLQFLPPRTAIAPQTTRLHPAHTPLLLLLPHHHPPSHSPAG